MNKVLRTMVPVLMLAGSFHVQAQCGTDEYNKDLLQSDSAAIQLYQRFLDNDLPSVIEYRNDGVQKKAIRVIPVVFHVIHAYGSENISKEQIEDQLRIINEDFQRLNADTGNTRSIFKGVASNFEIEFKLAKRTPTGECTDGITRTFSEMTDGGDDEVKKLIRWDYRKYLNIWVVKRISRGGLGGTVLGYAVFPNATSSQVDGVVIRHDYVGSIGTAVSASKGRTLTHEIGHWLGLYHTFQGGCSSNFSLTDQVDDTPPVYEPNYGCPIGVNSCSNDVPNQVDQVENYMDYSGDFCYNMFSEGQKNRVDFFLSSTTYRGWNISATTINSTGVNTNPVCKPIPDFHTEGLKTILCEGSGLIKFMDYSYNADITDRLWLFEGGTPSQSTFENPSVQYDSSGLYKVTLIVGNSEGYDTLVREQFITVNPSTAERKAPFGESFESAGFNIGWQIEGSNGDGWVRNTSRGYNSSNCMEAQIDQNTQSGIRYSLIMPPVDITSHGAPLNITFRHAYARRVSTQTEVLIIMVSEDCGESWSTVKGLTATNGLASWSGTLPNWAPSSNADWGYQVVNIDKYASSPNLMVRFDVISQSGNSVFLDNINIGQFGLSIDPVELRAALQIFPNPASSELHIKLHAQGLKTNLFLRDLSGRLLLQQIMDGSEAVLNTAGLSDGIYILEIQSGDYRWSEKIVINNR